VWLVLPVVGACAYSLVVQPVFTPRYLVTVLPAFILLASLGLRELGSRRGLIAAAAVAAVSLAVVPRVWSAHDVQGMASRGGIGVGARTTGRRCRDRAFL